MTTESIAIIVYAIVYAIVVVYIYYSVLTDKKRWTYRG